MFHYRNPIKGAIYWKLPGQGGDFVPDNEMFKNTTAVTSANILAIHTTPVVILPAVSNEIHIIRTISIQYYAGSTAYAGGSQLSANMTNGINSDLFETILAGTPDVYRAVNTLTIQDKSTNTSVSGDFVFNAANQTYTLSCVTPFTAGNGTMSVTVWYQKLSTL